MKRVAAMNLHVVMENVSNKSGLVIWMKIVRMGLMKRTVRNGFALPTNSSVKTIPAYWQSGNVMAIMTATIIQMKK